VSDTFQIPFGFDYVLVLEWLARGEERTGAQLHVFLQCLGIPSELVVCQSWDDVRQALEAAASDVQTKGVPVIHLETHGSSPWVGRAEDIAFGPDRSSGVPWAELGMWLAQLNVASDFRLLFVSAACWGSAVMGAIGGGEYPAPFAFAVGFRTTVGPGRLRDAMKELYRSLKGGLMLPDCVASAQRELTQGQELQLEVAVKLAVKILRVTYYNPEALRKGSLGRHRRRRRARRVWDSWFPPALQERVPGYRFEVARIDG
jgi:hypothetical protein